MGRGITHTAEEVADKDDEDATGDVVPGVEALERMRLAIAVQHDVVLYLVDDLARRQLPRRGDIALKVLRLRRVDLDWLGFCHGERNSKCGGIRMR